MTSTSSKTKVKKHKRTRPDAKKGARKTVDVKGYTRGDEKTVGYVVKGNKVFYRTKSGKKGSMPKGHVKMVSRWGLKKVSKL